MPQSDSDPLDATAPRVDTPAGAHLDALGTMGCVLLALITLGFAAFRFLPTLPTGAPRNPDRTFFVSVNAVTLTGFSQNSAITANYPTAGRALLITLALGGALTLLIGGGSFLRHVIGGRAMPLKRLIVLSFAVIAWPLLLAPGVGWFEALSAGTGIGFAPARMSAGWHWLLLSASIPASIGPIVLLGLFARRFSSPDRMSASILIALVALYSIGLFAFWAAGVPLGVASFESINTRSLGLNLHAPANLPPPMPWLMIAAMCLGAGPASVAGGLGVLPLIVAGSGAVAALRRRAVSPIVGVALTWIAAFVGVLVLFVALFASTNQAMPGDRQLFLIVSAFCNVGLSHDPLGITGPGLFVLSAAMIAGRVLPLMMLCWMAIVSGPTRGDSLRS